MHDRKAESTKRLVHLIESVHHATRLLASTATSTDAALPLRQFAEKIHEKVDQFEFELRTELTRVAAQPVIVCETTGMNVRLGLEAMLECYRRALDGNITAHTRAMLTRQFEEMQKILDEFIAITLPECDTPHQHR